MSSTAGRITYATAPGQPSFATECAQGPARRSNPLGAAEPNHVVIEQLYMQRADFYQRPAPNARCPEDLARGAVAYFIDDSPREPVGTADLVTWTRTWATVPARLVEFSSISVIYPGYGRIENKFQSDGAMIIAGSRPEWQATTRCRITTDFYLVGPGSSYAGPEDLPSNNPNTVTYPSTVTPAGANYYRFGGGFFLSNNNTAFSHPNGTTPTLSNYQGAVTSDAASPDSYSQIVEVSKPERYMGNIWKVVNTRIKAR